MKIVFAGGGTAGHVNPALAVAGYICKVEPGSQVWLSGGKGNIEEKLAAKAGYPIYTFPLKGLSRAKSLAGLKQTFRALLDMQKATGECKKILREIKPDVVIIQMSPSPWGMSRRADFAAETGAKVVMLQHQGMRPNYHPGAVEQFGEVLHERAPHLTYINPVHGEWIEL
jgi:UDP:flavonoid glycosyltransferase YjiC (YdhE family)